MYMISINKDMVVQDHGNICSIIIIPKTFKKCLKPLSNTVLRRSTTTKVLSTLYSSRYIGGYDPKKDYSKTKQCISRYYLNNCYRFFISNVVLNFIFCGKNPLPLKKSSGETLTISGSV